MRESTLERRLVREVECIGGRAPKWVSPGNRGVPDRIVILPGGRVAFVEMKAPGKPLAPLQVRWAKILSGLGHRVYRIDSDESIDRFIAEVTGDGVQTPQVSRVRDAEDH
ncbi:VRR-NUC domain-containing protein [Alicyclobacillus hesperidum]|uniref:VRR-NUC domain-containing protein n=1 Tax=Alicyclobacillus hesperidum TaxID=89784 RepID=UPI0024936F2E|nr:VRR-NUC domain-containing protein [Alicyclobacillus hesperidum]